MQRDPLSHKGQNGTVTIVGGSTFQHGAPIFSALAAEASGVDLVFVAVPAVHQGVTRGASLNFQVHPFEGDELKQDDVDMILTLLATADAAVIGPGLARTEKAQRVMQELMTAAPCPVVIDASALQPWTMKSVHGKSAVLTPHLGELERMGIEEKEVLTIAADAGVTIHVKGAEDRVSSPDGTEQIVKGGNAGLTVGGTGDALAGLIGGLMAQGMQPVEACLTASTVIKRAGTVLFQEKGFAYTTKEVIGEIPHLLHAFRATA